MDWGAVISAIALVAVAIIEAVAVKDRKNAKAEKERVERRAALREHESHLSMQMMSAACALALVTAKKVTGMHTNGDVEEAMDKAREAQANYQTFLEETAARQLAKQ